MLRLINVSPPPQEKKTITNKQTNKQQQANNCNKQRKSTQTQVQNCMAFLMTCINDF
jgi:hypothetical protein